MSIDWTSARPFQHATSEEVFQSFWQTGLDFIMRSLGEIERGEPVPAPLTPEKVRALHQASGAAVASLVQRSALAPDA